MNDPDCIFCKIVAGDIPATKVYENEHVTVFPDINPQAPTHLLIIPNTHVISIAETEDPAIYAHCVSAAKAVAAENGLKDFRLAVNNGAGAGQSVFHLHFHLLAGRAFTWPPG